MENQLCKNCQHFYQHYGLGERGFYRLHCGHCGLPRLRTKRPHQKACAEFVQGESKENAFASKEYLSKALLDRVMQLELLPEIPDEDML